MGRATKRASRELTGDDGNFVVTTDLGNEFATLDRELPAEAVHRTKRHPDAEEGPGHEGGAQGRAVERPLRAGGRQPSADERGEDVQQLGAVDSMTVRSTEGRETLLKLALPAPQGGPADETGQAGGCEAAGRLPGASEAQPLEARLRPGNLGRIPFWRKKKL